MCCFVCRDAQDAARGRDGYDFFGNRLRVEMSRGARERGPPPAPPTFRGRGTGFRVLIKGLPISASWQDLKVRTNEKTALYMTSSVTPLVTVCAAVLAIVLLCPLCMRGIEISYRMGKFVLVGVPLKAKRHHVSVRAGSFQGDCQASIH